MIKKYKKVVVKIGSNSIVDSKTKKIKSKWLDNLCKDIAELNKTKKIVIVCSGAIALGAKSISNTRLRKLEDKQAAASVAFDEDSLKPKYILNWGIPGRSNVCPIRMRNVIVYLLSHL